MNVRTLVIPAAVALSLALAPGMAQAQDGDPWNDGDEAALRGQAAERRIVPQRYRFVELDRQALQARLAEAPLEFTPVAAHDAPILALPLPDGSALRFRVEESPIMEPALAALYPEIKTYRGQSVDDPTATTRFDWTSSGFHAIVLSSAGTVYIDPYRRGDTVHYISYFARDNLRNPGFRCLGRREPLGKGEGVDYDLLVPSGATLRTYRLALAADFEYSTFHSLPNPPNVAAVLNNGIIPTMNRVDGIYEREVAARMVLIAGENSIIFITANDPYTNNDGGAMLNENQATLDSIIGSANYDIGHVFSTGGGGIAGLGVVCQNGQKAFGVTGLTNPVGDNFDVDYVAHEMGHQFGGNHTFNSSTSNCGGGNRHAATAYEVGSGSTIMAYAGICGNTDLQPHSDDYFHNISFVEIQAYTNNGSGNACAVQTATGNHAPLVNAGPDFNIPKSTPFALTGSATDQDNDPLTYTWEEMDLGPAGDGRTDNGSSPILRSFKGTTDPTRTLPRLSDILGNIVTYGEILPTTTRALKFRLTARDNRATGGGVDWAPMQVNVSATAGPFAVTAPNTNVTWIIGQPATVTWAVANTTAAPINTAQVTIRLSTDGGLTFPTALATATANDGTETIIVPNQPSTTARVKVEAVGNVFFDISDANFGLMAQPTQAAAPAALAVDTGGNGVLQPGETAVVVAPSWLNTGSGALASATGILSNFTGPAGPTYTINDSTAAYGTIAPGATASCATAGNCYAVSISSGTRPVQHWDATASETISPSANSKTWTLHVGDSFSDVTGGNTFYRFVETLFHNGVTGGCGGASYCGSTATPREQMSVFVLVSKEGSGYTPPACGTPVFNDVPASSPFCRWIEELARRGVVSGCGGGAFCPSTSVTREQMAIFVLRTLDPTLTPPACVPPNLFNDVPETSAFCRWIEELANRGIVTGCGGGNYCPTAAVTREQMAVFLASTFGLELYAP